MSAITLHTVARDIEFQAGFADEKHVNITIVVLNAVSRKDAERQVVAFLEDVRQHGARLEGGAE